MIVFSNPRLEAIFDDWPSGGERVRCKFTVEDGGKKGQRVFRTTTKNNQWCKPKADTFANKVAIVDGDDGKTYILKYQNKWGDGSITIMRHDFKYADGDYYFQSKDDRYAELMSLINAAM